MQDNIGAFLSKRAYLSPELEAIVDYDTDRRFNYRELNQRANALANAASKAGIKKGDRVALLVMNSVEFVESFFGLAKIGAVVVPLNWRLVADELSYILKNSGTTLLIYSSDFAAAVADIHDRGPDGSAVESWIEITGENERQLFASDYYNFVDATATLEPTRTTKAENLAFIMYTSGTTGLPKGVMHSHYGVTWAQITLGPTIDFHYGDRYSIVLPLFHVGALTPVIACAYKGVTAVLLRQFDPSAMWRVTEAEKITTTLAVPAMLNFMLQVPAKDEVDFSSLRWVLSGASPVPVSLIQTYADMGIEIHQLYGLTESGGPGTCISPDDALVRIGSAGKEYYHTEVRVVRDNGEDVAPDEPGELIVRGEHNMLGYWQNPEATAEVLRDGWLYTGDIALIDADGFITIHDRVKDMIISGGENVYPAEIENIILSHPKVADVAVIGRANAEWGESPFAVMVAAEEGTSVAEVMQFCDGKLARFKLPKDGVFVDEIPRNPTGKPLKRLLREQFPG
jgi:acyl-CoA synthetase (AMP-forming)/AMP-acid ligase II